MIIKIETRKFYPSTQEVPGNFRRHFALIDGVSDVSWGEMIPLSKVPHPMPEEDGTVTEVELFLGDNEPVEAGDLVDPIVNLISFKAHTIQRVLAVRGSIYLCNEGGDTLEVIRS